MVAPSRLQVPVLRPMELMVEASPRRIFANAHTYHINSISINSDGETYLSADDLRYVKSYFEVSKLYVFDLTSFSLFSGSICGIWKLQISPLTLLTLSQLIWKSWPKLLLPVSFFFFLLFLWFSSFFLLFLGEFHPKECNHFVYSSSKGTIRLCDMRQAALCDTHAKRK